MGTKVAVVESKYAVIARTSIKNFKWSKIAVFDIDGVIVDVSERLKASLEEVGASGVSSTEALPAELRRRFWSVFLSAKYMHLDKPRRVGIELLNRAREEGNFIVLVSGRRESMLKDTIKQLRDFGVEWDVLVHRAENYYAKDHEFKKDFVKEYLGGYVSELHDDMDSVCLVFAAGVSFPGSGQVVIHRGVGAEYVAKHVDNYWFSIPSFTVRLVDSREHSIAVNVVDFTADHVRGLIHPVTVKWMWIEKEVNTDGELLATIRTISQAHSSFVEAVWGGKVAATPQDLVAYKDNDSGRTWLIPGHLIRLLFSGER